MRQVDDLHDPEDQAEAGGDQEQDGGVEDRVQNLDDQDIHASRLPD
jgi:hypothetical protein